MKKLLCQIILIALATPLWAGEPKEYSLTLNVLETDAQSSKADGTRTTTTCASSGTDQITCDSRQIAGALHTELVSYATASDGKAYLISCIRNAGARFAQGFAAGTGAATVTGCMVPPGTYKARWDKGRLKVLHENNGKSTETTFAVLSSVLSTVAIPSGKSAQSEQVSNGEKTVLKLSSSPLGADIGLDGSFVGQTPSSVLVLPGDHYVKIMKTGYKPWERTIRTSGGEVTVFAELEPQDK